MRRNITPINLRHPISLRRRCNLLRTPTPATSYATIPNTISRFERIEAAALECFRVAVPRRLGVPVVAVEQKGEGGEDEEAEGDAEADAEFGGLG